MKRRRILLMITLLSSVVILMLGISRREPAADGRSVTHWLENLEDYDSDEPNAAAIALRKIGTNALPWMVQEMKREKSKTRRWIESQIKRQSLVKFRFADEDAHRNHAATAFEILGDVAAPAIPELIRLLEAEHADPWVQQALVYIGPASIGPLTNALTSSNADLRQHAADTLEEFGPAAASATPALLRCLDDPEILARTAAIDALGSIHSHPEEVIPALTGLLRDPNKYVRRDAAIALGCYCEVAEVAIDELLKLVVEDETEVGGWAIRALGRIGRRSDQVVPVLLAQWTNNASLQPSIVETLSSFPDKSDETLPILFAATKGRYWWEAFNSLGKMTSRSETIAPFLVSLLKDNKPERRYYAASALGELGDKSEETIMALKELQNDNAEFWNGSMGNTVVRRAAESSLFILQREQRP
jgi:HEAT repeat protein